MSTHNLVFPFHSSSQLDDVDARRCRDGRSQYLGHISFFMIAVPMILILMNEALGSAVIDAAIPAMYSSIFVLGAYLYSISLLVLLLTFCLVIAAVFYWTLVYRPARKAHFRRKEKMRRMRSGGHSPLAVRGTKIQSAASSPTITRSKSASISASRSGSVSAYLRRVFNIMRHSLQHGITLLSLTGTRYSKEKDKEKALQRVWQAMNRSAPISSSSRNETETEDSPLKLVQSRRNSTLSPDYSALASIEKLKPSFRMKDVAFTDPYWSHFSSETVVVALNIADEFPRRLTSQTVFEARDMFALMRSRLLSRAESRDHDFVQGAVVSESVLYAEYRRALDVFHPDGIALSPTEIEEACELYDQWKVSVNEQFMVKIVGSAAVRERMIRLSLFEEWMSKGILVSLRNNLTDRLMDRTLQRVPRMMKRLSDATCPTDKTAAPTNKSIKFRRNMKKLNVVTPHNLVSLSDYFNPAVPDAHELTPCSSIVTL